MLHLHAASNPEDIASSDVFVQF